MFKSLRLSTDVIVRMVIDVIIILTSFYAAVALIYIGTSLAGVTVTSFLPSDGVVFVSILLTSASIVIYTVSGFYTHGRAYRSRYKALLILQACTNAHMLTLSLLVIYYIFTRAFQLGSFLVLLLTLSLLLTSTVTIVARTANTLWRFLSFYEQKLLLEPSQDPRPQLILIIGGAGYIGSALTRQLLDKGYRVRILDLLLFGEKPIAQFKDHPNLEVMQADFRRVDRVVEAMTDVHSVVHLGAIVGDPACAVDEDLTIEVNLKATQTIAEIAKGSGIKRFIFASTCSVYGASSEFLNEHSSLNPVSLYAKSKIAAEQVLRELADAHFQPIILRFGTIYGFSGRTRFDLVVNLLTAKAVLESDITVFGGEQWRPFLHVNDAALAVVRALEVPLAIGGNRTYNVGSNEQNYQIKEIAEIIREKVPQAHVSNNGDDADRRDYRVDFTRVVNELQFTPQWTLERGIEQIVQSIESGEISDYRDPMYSNFKYLTENDKVLHQLRNPQNVLTMDIWNAS